MTTESASSPYTRENFWGDDVDDGDALQGHEETGGTDPAEYLAFRHISQYVEPVCARTGLPLSDPEFYLPKQHETEHGYDEYRQHRHRRRVNKETGFINWGESTSTGLPEVEYETFKRAVESFLLDRGVSCLRVDEYDELADRYWHDPQYNSRDALAQFISKVRDREP